MRFFEGGQRAAQLAVALASNKAMQCLKAYALPEDVCEVVVSAVKSNDAVRSVLFAAEPNNGNPTGMALVDVLRHSDHLESAEFRAYNQVIDMGVGMALAEAFRGHRMMKSFAYHATDGATDESTSSVGMAMADVLKHHRTLKSFKFTCWDAGAGVAMADALRHNTALESFDLFLEAGGGIGRFGVAMADALKHQRTLKSFRFEACGVHDTAGLLETGIAMAEALCHNRTLESFAFIMHVPGSDRQGEVKRISAAMALALKHNATLRSFALEHCGGEAGCQEVGLALSDAIRHNGALESLVWKTVMPSREWKAAMLSALRENVSILSFKHWQSLQSLPVSEIVKRNVEIRKLRHALTSIARLTDDFGFSSLADRAFRARVFSFFIPAGCKWTPCDFQVEGPRKA